jgi:hypothetical protein
MILEEIRTYDSSNIKSSEYNFNTRDLILTFKGGGKYKYVAVDKESYYKFTNAESVGKAFHKYINNNYEFKFKISE